MSKKVRKTQKHLRQLGSIKEPQLLGVRELDLSEKEEVKRIVEKYHKSMFELSEQATIEEFKTVMKYVVEQVNFRRCKSINREKRM